MPSAGNFHREAYCLFGLPVDNLTLAATQELLRANAREEGNNVLSTINVNWVAQSWRDPQFHAAVLNSETVTLDGEPLLWLARLQLFSRYAADGLLLLKKHQHRQNRQLQLTNIHGHLAKSCRFFEIQAQPAGRER